MAFGEQLRQERDAAGLTQAELAERAGLSVSAVGALERGERRRPYSHTVRALATALALSGARRAELVAAASRPTPHPPTPIMPARRRQPDYLTTLIGRGRKRW